MMGTVSTFVLPTGQDGKGALRCVSHAYFSTSGYMALLPFYR